jgi:hypothetical protein
MNKGDCSCNPMPSTSEEHTAKAIELIRSAYANGNEPAPKEDEHIDHHFKHGAGDFE